MADLVLTSERRAELAELLSDGPRLDAEYPKVAEYLDTAVRLSGTGDAEADRALDVRLVHYMTSGSEDESNPYWAIVEPCVSERDGRRVVDGGKRDGSAKLGFAQIILQAVYAYAVPSPATVEWVKSFCDGNPLIEVGAGRGYWAAQLRRSGVQVDAYDSVPPDQGQNMSFPVATGQRDVWHPVSGLEKLRPWPSAAGESVLLLCWPPGWGDKMAAEALASFEEAGGRRLIYIGEPKGGKTADDEFFDRLSSRWRLVGEDSEYVAWWTSNDAAQGWVCV